MPIMSYLAYPMEGKRDDLARDLGSLPGCQVIPSENRDLLVLVTDTKCPKEEEALHQRLNQVESLQCLAMVFGHNDH